MAGMPSRRRPSARALSRGRRRRLPLSRLSAERGQPGRRGAARGRAARSTISPSGALRPARTVAVGFSVGSGVAASLAAAAPARRPDPGHPVRFAGPGRRPAIIPGCRCGLLFRHRDGAGRGSARQSRRRSRSSPAAATPLIPPPAPRRFGSPCPISPSTGRSPEAGHNDIYRQSRFAPAIREALAQFAGTR